MDNEQQPKNSKSKKIVKVIPAKADRMRDETDKPKIRTAAYCRVSSGDQDQQTSYSLQVKHYTQYIKKNKEWEFSGIYADEGISGTSIKNRTNFLKMIEDCKAGKIDLVVTKSISRFARNTLDCINYVRMLKALQSPVGVYFEKENLDSLDSKSEFILTILSSLAQDESRNISENVKWAIQKQFQQGKARCPTTYFLGYDKDEKGNLIINEEQAKTVRRIYKEYLEGYGSLDIAKKLTAEGVKTGKGKTKWSDTTVLNILKNEKYCGDVLMQKCFTADFLTHRIVRNRGQQPQYFIENHHPAIVPKEEWNSVQRELDRRSKHYRIRRTDSPQRQNYHYTFSNKLYCGSCGEPFMRRTFASKRKNQKYLYPAWRCRIADGRVQDKKCCAISYREIALEHSFMIMLVSMKNEKEQILKEAECAIAERDLDEWEEERMKLLKREINSLTSKLHDLAESEAPSSSNEVYDDVCFDISQEIELLQKEYNQYNIKKTEAAALRTLLNWFIEELGKLEEFDWQKKTTKFREDIFRKIAKRGVVHDDGSIDYELIFGIYRKSTENGYAIWRKDREAESEKELEYIDK